MSSSEEVDIVLADPPNLIKDFYFDQWLTGKPYTSWVSIDSDFHSNFVSRYPKFTGNFSIDRNCNENKLCSLSLAEKADANRFYNHLEHSFSLPSVMEPHLKIWFQIPRNTRLKLIEKYYSYDSQVMREIINKRLTKSRREAEEIAEITRSHKGSVTRQVENVKRMYSLVFDESKQFQGNLIKAIETLFLLPVQLCRRYASLLFLVYSKFDLTSKRKVLRIPCSTLERFSLAIMAFLLPDGLIFNEVASNNCSADTLYPLIPDYLTSVNTDEIGDSKAWDFVWDLCSRIDSIEPDKTLLASLRHIRTTLLGEQLDLRVKVIKRQLQSTPVGSQIVLKLSANGKLKFLVTALLDIGSHLSQSREFKGLIEDIVVKIGDVFEETGFTIFETNMFLISCLSLIDYAPGSASRMSTFEAASSSRRNSGLPDMQMAASSISAVSSTGILRDSPPSLLTGTSNSVSGNGSVNPSFVSHSANNSGRSYRGDNISSGSFSTSTKGGPVEVFRDWCRFISCVRLCLEQLAALKPYR